jgi:hypothetical protein
MGFTGQRRFEVEGLGCPFSREASHSLHRTSLLDLRSAGADLHNLFKSASTSMLVGA